MRIFHATVISQALDAAKLRTASITMHNDHDGSIVYSVELEESVPAQQVHQLRRIGVENYPEARHIVDEFLVALY
jgi:hypothetical protein